MNYGLYLSASGVLTNLYRQDVFANNLANVQTHGFKPDLPTIRQRAPESVEDSMGLGVSKPLLDRLGGGVLAGPQHIRFEPGPLTRTQRPLDAALGDDQTFFVVKYRDAASGQSAIRLTRDGRFSLNGQGQLVTAAGFPVLDDQDRPIVIPAGVKPRINDRGQLMTHDGKVVGQVQVAHVDDTDRLFKQGQGLFNYNGPDPREPVADPIVKPGYIEASGVDPIQALMKLTEATKAVRANADMIKFFDRLMEQAVNKLGRVA